MTRKLASIQTVHALEPIAGADAIELARIQGWQCVVKKGEFAVGDHGVFFEIDSQPPDEPRYAFLWTPRSAAAPVARPANYRLRTIRLRGALSQGLLLRLADFPELSADLPPGDDLTDILGITKWEAPVPLNGDVAGPFVPGVPKTDETRVQSEPGVIDELLGLPYVITLKCDGTSATFGLRPHTGEFLVCGRNWAIKDGDNAYWHVARSLRLEEILRQHPDIVIQGEIVGPGIQKNRLGLRQVSLCAFNVYFRPQARYFDHDEAAAFLAEARIPMVAVVERGGSFGHSLESLLALAEGVYPGTKNEREGIVIRPATERRCALLSGRLSFKAINNRFLLAGGE